MPIFKSSVYKKQIFVIHFIDIVERQKKKKKCKRLHFKFILIINS